MRQRKGHEEDFGSALEWMVDFGVVVVWSWLGILEQRCREAGFPIT
jgi:hypothetical protein